MTARLRLVDQIPDWETRVRAIVEERRARNALRLALKEAARERRERRRKKAVLAGFFASMFVLWFSIAAPYEVLKEAALRMAQAATVFLALLVIGIVVKTACDFANVRMFVRPTKDGSSAGTEVPKGE